LLEELLRVELAYRRAAGEQPQPEEYAQRFPALDPAWLGGAASVTVAEQPGPMPPPGATTPPVTDGPAGGPGRRVGDYELLGELGRGGMGVVYKARQLSRDRLVALKMILTGRGAQFTQLARFRVEVEAVACLAHPNIVRIHDIGVHAGYPFFALEFAPGGSLAQRIQKQPQPPRWAAELARTLALALHHAHERGILHRDLKPANVLLMEDGTPKITDFGLAKFLRPIQDVSEIFCTLRSSPGLDEELVRLMLEQRGEELLGLSTEATIEEIAIQSLCQQRLGRFGSEVVSRGLAATQQFVAEAGRQNQADSPPELSFLNKLTAAGTIMGSLHYMAPEQARGETSEIGPAADVYALGAVLYELLTGHPPFQAATRSQLLQKVLSQPPSPIQPKVSRNLEAICLKCLRKSPRQRYSRAADLADDLQQFLSGYAVRAPVTDLMPSPPPIESLARAKEAMGLPTHSFAPSPLRLVVGGAVGLAMGVFGCWLAIASLLKELPSGAPGPMLERLFVAGFGILLAAGGGAVAWWVWRLRHFRLLVCPRGLLQLSGKTVDVFRWEEITVIIQVIHHHNILRGPSFIVTGSRADSFIVQHLDGKYIAFNRDKIKGADTLGLLLQAEARLRGIPWRVVT
jgi:serine/threonine protein kinase